MQRHGSSALHLTGGRQRMQPAGGRQQMQRPQWKVAAGWLLQQERGQRLQKEWQDPAPRPSAKHEPQGDCWRHHHRRDLKGKRSQIQSSIV